MSASSKGPRRSVGEGAIYETADAPLLALVGSRSSIAWLAVLGPADRAEPLLTRLEPFARVFFTRDRGSS